MNQNYQEYVSQCNILLCYAPLLHLSPSTCWSYLENVQWEQSTAISEHNLNKSVINQKDRKIVKIDCLNITLVKIKEPHITGCKST